MKKLLIVLLALTIVGVFAVAEDAPASISVGGWGRMWFNVIASDGIDQFVSAGPGWAGNGGRVSVGFNGNSANMGFNWNPGVSNSGMTAVCDQAKIWAQINPMIKVEVGQIQGDVLRGKLDDFGDILPTQGKDNIFARFNPDNGILLDIPRWTASISALRSTVSLPRMRTPFSPRMPTRLSRSVSAT